MAENEVVFRQYNENMQKSVSDLNDLAAETGQHDLGYASDEPIYFYCECSDENCRRRVRLEPSKYSEIHKHRDRFVIVCGHEVSTIELVIGKSTNFCIVEKFHTPPQRATKLNQTNTKNI